MPTDLPPDLMQVTADTVFAALNVADLTGLAPVYASVPKNAQPPFVVIGAIDAEEIGSKHESLEQLSVELEFQHRGPSKRPLFAMMHMARTLLERAKLTSPGTELETPRWQASATDREDDGVTYHGVQRFELHAQIDHQED